ncbi:archease [Streptomyces sp. bgisy153]|uniref:archease n=1 Tax=Streptomyces sp. bgisy153 TaxID=3413793 RepID=UPI003D7073EE
MVGESGDERAGRRQGDNGHRTVPHTADVRIEAWGASREQCLVEAVLGLVECFADVSRAHPTAVERVHLSDDDGDDLLAALLDEVILELEVRGRVPVDVVVEPAGEALEARLAVAELSDVEIVGAAPKGVSWHGLHIGVDPYGWSCAVTVDV